MLRCIRTHDADGFGEIPEGSLWAEDSPYVGKSDAFEQVAEGDDEKPAKKAAAKRAATKKGDD